MPRLRVAFILLLVAVLAGAGLAPAQFLDLDSSKAPAAGSGARVLELAARLDQQAASDRRSAAKATDLQQAVLLARASMRETSRALLQAGESIGARGSTHIVLALRLRDSANELERVVENTDETDRAALEPTLLALDRPIGTVPEQPGLLEPWLQRRYALLVETARDRARATRRRPPWVVVPGRVGWWRPPTSGMTMSLDMVRGAQTDARVVEALETLTARAEREGAFWSYRTTTGYTLFTAREAWESIDRRTLPGWLPVNVGEAMRTSYGEALLAIANGTDPAGGTRALRTLRDLGRLAWRVSGLERAGVPLHAPVTDLLRDASASPSTAGPRLRAASDALGLLEARPALGDERTIVRSLRPAWRVLEPVADRAERALLTDAPRLLASPDAMMDPSLVGRVAAHRRAISDLRLVREISDWMKSLEIPRAPDATQRDRDAEANRRLAEMRVLELSKAVANDERGEALELLRAFGATLADARSMRGESVLRQDPSALDPLTNRRGSALLEDLESTRSAWFEAWATADSRRGSGNDPTRFADRLTRLRRLLAHLADAWETEAIGANVGIDGWPGLYVAEDTRARLMADTRRELGSLTTQVLTRDAGTADRALDRFETGDGVLALLARLDREARAHGAVGAPSILLIGEPMSDDAWLASHRDDLHAISRYLFELTGALTKGDGDRARRLESYVRLRCDDLLALLGPFESVDRE